MKILYYTSGVTGSGRIVSGIAIANALKRRNIECEYVILSSSNFAFLAGEIRHIEIPIEDEHALSATHCRDSMLYKTITGINPDVLLVDLQWFTLHHFIDELPCKKIFLSRQVHDRFFAIPLPNEKLVFRPESYNRVLATEPFASAIPMERINPIVIRNRDEILPGDAARTRLNLDGNRQTCLFSFNGHPGDFERVRKSYSYLGDIYNMIYTTNYKDGGLFPVVDYFNAFDFIVCGAGYNQFWEVIYFDKEAVFEPTRTIFEDQARRIRECQEYYFDVNGADQLADMIIRI